MKIDKKFINEYYIGKDGRFNGKKLEFSGLPYTTKDFYLIYHNINEPKCPVCGDFTPFFGFKRGFQVTCSIKCSKNYEVNKIKINKPTRISEFLKTAPNCKCGLPLKRQNGKLSFKDSCGKRECIFHQKMVQEKRKETTLKKYGVDHISKLDKIKHNKKIKMLSKNFEEGIFDKNEKLVNKLIRIFGTKKDDKELYYKLVDKITYKNRKNISNIEIVGVEQGYQLDHKFSKFMGFMLNIPPYIIGSTCNLEVVTTQFNTSKSLSCSISQKELYNLFFGGIINE